MESKTAQETLLEYTEQLKQVEAALKVIPNGEDKDNLLTLKSDLTQLIQLTQQSSSPSSSNNSQTVVDDEYSLFMAEMVKEGAFSEKKAETDDNVTEDLNKLEGMKCRAPHKHSWGDTAYHNALISSVIPLNGDDFNEIEVKVLFMNPTHEEMLPCPYLLESECKFSDDKCRYSHGEIVLFSSLEEYIEPDYENLAVGSLVLAKYDKLWYRAIVKRLFKDRCLVKFDANNKELEITFQDIHPLNESHSEESEESDDDLVSHEDVINMSLMITPMTEKMGDWEKHTKGIGSRLMEKMGYVIGTGLGKRADGILNPVTAVILPKGKSLDHCMLLREKSGGDTNLFSAEKKLKRMQRKQEQRSQKMYEQEKKKVDVFNFLNETLSTSKEQLCLNKMKTVHRSVIKKGSNRDLNVESLKVDEAIKEVDRDLVKIKESLGRHKDVNSPLHKELKKKLVGKQAELKILKDKAVNLNNEKSMRNDKRKLTIF